MRASLLALAREARTAGAGLGAFNVIQLEQAAAFVRAAERAQRPVVLQISENAVTYHGALAPLARAALELAEQSAVPVVVHLDHAENLDLIRQAIDLGLQSVMYDGSKLPDAENRERTAMVVQLCHAAGLDVEAELGEVGGKNGVHDPSARTSPTDAAAFVADTGVDLLAVAVGSSHAMTTRDAHLDDALIREIRAAVEVPLVLHGSSGVSDAGMCSAIRAGITKVNVSTHLNKLLTGAVRETLTQNPALVDPRRWLGPGWAATEAEAQRLLELYAGASAVMTDR